jgi:hypothetical protein
MSRASNRRRAQGQRQRKTPLVPACYRAALDELIETEDALACLVLAGPDALAEWAGETQALLDRIYTSGPAADLYPNEPAMLLGWAARMVLVRLAKAGPVDLDKWLDSLTRDRNLHADLIAHSEALRAFHSRAWDGLR